MKFGGASVGTTTALTQVLSIVIAERERWDHLILVVSALDGVTDALIEAAQLAKLSNRRGYRRIVATLRTRHLSLADQLPLGQNERQALQADIDRLLFDMLDVCQALASRTADIPASAAFDEIIGVGERLAARIVASLLRHNNLRGVAIDATDLIVTDETYGHASPNIALTRERITQRLTPMLSRNIIPVVTGFIGATESGQPTTLGRGGSDYTASIIAVCADSSEVWMWTDVDGIMSADPQEVPMARNIPELSYQEIAELAYFGARIIHARMIGPLRDHQIPLYVKNIFKPREVSTVIRAAGPGSSPNLKAVTAIQGIGLVADYSGPLTKIITLIDRVLHKTTGSHLEVMFSAQSSARSFVCFLIPTTIGSDALRTTQQTLQKDLQSADLNSMWELLPVSVITLIAPNINQAHDQTARALQAIKNTEVLALVQGPSGCSLTLVVNFEAAEQTLDAIHAAILSSG